MVVYMMERYPFESIYQALKFFLSHNPARQKFVNVLEPETLAGKSTSDKNQNECIYICVLFALERIKKYIPEHEYDAFEDFHLRNLSKDDIAFDVGRSKRTVARWIYKAETKFARELTDMRALDPEYLKYN